MAAYVLFNPPWVSSRIDELLFGACFKFTRDRGRGNAGTFLEILRMSIISAWPHRAACVGELRARNSRMLDIPNDTFRYMVKHIVDTFTAIARG